MVHKAIVDVSEASTEAAAANGVGLRIIAVVRAQPPLLSARFTPLFS
jgi:serine protease inhibitor